MEPAPNGGFITTTSKRFVDRSTSAKPCAASSTNNLRAVRPGPATDAAYSERASRTMASALFQKPLPSPNPLSPASGVKSA